MNHAERAACLVVLTDSLYLPGTRVAVASWTRHNGEIPIVALSVEPAPLEDPFLCRIAAQRHLIDSAPYAAIRPYAKRKSGRYAAAFFKFEAFRDFGFARNLYLDSDVLCLRPAHELVDASDANHALLAAPETGFRKTRSYKGHASEINSGVLSIPRSLQGAPTVARLIDIATRQPGRGGYNAGDQGILNKWIHQDNVPLALLDPSFNLIKKDYADLSGLDSCRLLHFADRKPWFPPRAFRDGAIAPLTALENLWRANAAVDF